MRAIEVIGQNKLDEVMSKMYPDIHGPVVVYMSENLFRVYYQPEFNFPIDDVGERWDDESETLIDE